MSGAPETELLLLRVLVGTALGGVIGYERDRHRRPVGLRTHMIVALAAATFMIVSIFFREFQELSPDLGMEVDVSRIAASVVSGIGFLAGGAILRTGLTVQGLTTAAGLWLVTAIGMAAGAGMLALATAVTGIGVVVLTLMRSLEARIGDRQRHRVDLTLTGDPDPLFAALRSIDTQIEHLEYEKAMEDQRIRLTFDLLVPLSMELAKVTGTIESVPQLERVRISS